RSAGLLTAAWLSARTGLSLRALTNVELTLHQFEIELRVAIARVETQRLAIGVARVVETSEAEQRVRTVVLRDRAQVDRRDVDRVRVVGQRALVVADHVEGVPGVDRELGRVRILLLKVAVRRERVGIFARGEKAVRFVDRLRAATAGEAP